MSVRSLFENPKVEVKEVSTSFGTVFVRRLPYEVITSLQEKSDKDNLIQSVGLCLCEADGTPVFQPEEFCQLAKSNGHQLAEIYEAAIEFNSVESKVALEKKE